MASSGGPWNQPPKKSGKGAIIALVSGGLVLVLALIAGGGYLIFQAATDDDEPVATSTPTTTSEPPSTTQTTSPEATPTTPSTSESPSSTPSSAPTSAVKAYPGAGKCLTIRSGEVAEKSVAQARAAVINCQSKRARVRIVASGRDATECTRSQTDHQGCLSHYDDNYRLVRYTAIPKVGDCFAGFRNTTRSTGMIYRGWPTRLLKCGAPSPSWADRKQAAKKFGIKTSQTERVEFRVLRIARPGTRCQGTTLQEWKVAYSKTRDNVVCTVYTKR